MVTSDIHTFLQANPLFRIFLILTAGVLSGEFIFTGIPAGATIILTVMVIVFSLFLRKSDCMQSFMIMFSVYLSGICMIRISKDSHTEIKEGMYDYHAIVTSTVKQKEKYSSFDLTCMSGGIAYKIKATVKGRAVLYPGDHLHVYSKIKPPTDAHEERFSYADYLKRNGYAASTFINPQNIQFIDEDYDILPLTLRIRIKLLQIRSSLLAELNEEGLSGRDFATVSAMAFGDKTYLSSQDREVYSKSGVSHVLALSGLHIGIIYTFLAFILYFVPRIPRFLIIQAAIWFYVLFAGMSPSLIRAALMISIYSLGTLTHREKLSVNTLALAGIISVVFSPQIIFDICFQLSFMSVFAILLFYRPILHYLPTHNVILRKISQMTSISVAAYVGTMPIILYNFGSISFVFIITNLFVVPLTSLVVYLSILSLLPLIGTYITGLLTIVIHTMNTLVNYFAGYSFTSVENVVISSYTAISLYICIFALYIINRKLTHNDKFDVNQ